MLLSNAWHASRGWGKSILQNLTGTSWDFYTHSTETKQKLIKHLHDRKLSSKSFIDDKHFTFTMITKNNQEVFCHYSKFTKYNRKSSLHPSRFWENATAVPKAPHCGIVRPGCACFQMAMLILFPSIHFKVKSSAVKILRWSWQTKSWWLPLPTFSSPQQSRFLTSNTMSFQFFVFDDGRWIHSEPIPS